ncbi:MAG TPA: M15 family metallopeptidase [Actinoplanes sp.]|nr:M15 family metallopeptidase [Actinoplanes sp.]
MAFDFGAMMTGLGQTATAAGPSQQALLLRARTRQRAAASRAQRQALLAELMASGVRAPGMAAGGGGVPSGRSPSLPRGRGLTTITAPNGQRVTVSATYANRFTGLLNDLWKAGYKFKSVGGYNYRNLAGTKTLSKHAFGEAIDIDPGPNRGTRLGGGGARYGYFNPKVAAALARKWGLDWGGLWRGQEDPMHFSTGG